MYRHFHWPLEESQSPWAATVISPPKPWYCLTAWAMHMFKFACSYYVSHRCCSRYSG